VIEIDIIVVSRADNDLNLETTERCLRSIRETQSEGYQFNIIVVESVDYVEYENALTLHYDFDFNYNKCLNLGLKHSSARYKGLCNNDLVFHYGWADGIVKALNAGFGSVSPYCLNSHIRHFERGNYVKAGFRIGRELSGWAIFATDKTINTIGTISESVSFWYSDDIYGEQLKVNGIKHGVVCNAFVTHICSVTLNQVFGADRRNITTRQSKAFNSEKNKMWRGKKGTIYHKIYGELKEEFVREKYSKIKEISEKRKQDAIIRRKKKASPPPERENQQKRDERSRLYGIKKELEQQNRANLIKSAEQRKRESEMKLKIRMNKQDVENFKELIQNG
jgi:hypothetical protein